jgi:hypothetical protein
LLRYQEQNGGADVPTSGSAPTATATTPSTESHGATTTTKSRASKAGAAESGAVFAGAAEAGTVFTTLAEAGAEAGAAESGSVFAEAAEAEPPLALHPRPDPRRGSAVPTRSTFWAPCFIVVSHRHPPIVFLV